MANTASGTYGSLTQAAEQAQFLREVDDFRRKGQADIMRRAVINTSITAVFSAATAFFIKRQYFAKSKPQPVVFFAVMPPMVAFTMTTDKGAIAVDEEIQRRFFDNNSEKFFIDNAALAAKYQKKSSIFSKDGLYDFVMTNRVSLVAGSWLATVAGVFIYQYRTPGLTRLQRGYNMRLFSQTAAFGAVCAAMALTAMGGDQEKYRHHESGPSFDGPSIPKNHHLAGEQVSQ